VKINDLRETASGKGGSGGRRAQCRAATPIAAGFGSVAACLDVRTPGEWAINAVSGLREKPRRKRRGYRPASGSDRPV
jgi:hypothetical protein